MGWIWASEVEEVVEEIKEEVVEERTW